MRYRELDERHQEEGQAVVEYLLVTAVALMLLGIMTTSFRTGVTKIWDFYIRKVSAACPTGCSSKYRIP